MLRLKGYIITLCICYVIDFLLNMTLSLCGVYGFSVFFAFWYSALITLSLFLFDVVAALLCRLIPKSKINIHSKIFKTFKWHKMVERKNSRIGRETWRFFKIEHTKWQLGIFWNVYKVINNGRDNAPHLHIVWHFNILYISELYFNFHASTFFGKCLF